MNPSAADKLVSRMLRWDCRIAVLAQLVRAYRVGGIRNAGAARRCLRAQVASGLLGFADVLARPLLDISEPLYSWPGTGRPDYEILPHLAWTLERRWQLLKLRFLTFPDQIAARYSLGCDCRSCLASTFRPVGVSVFSASSFSSRCSAS